MMKSEDLQRNEEIIGGDKSSFIINLLASILFLTNEPRIEYRPFVRYVWVSACVFEYLSSCISAY